jgi:hypothetical protein
MTEYERQPQAAESKNSKSSQCRVQPLVTRPVRSTSADSVEGKFQCGRRAGYAREHERPRRVLQLGILDQNRSVELFYKISESRRSTARHENEERSGLGKAAREPCPPLTPHDLGVDQGISSARHNVEIWSSFDVVADLVEGDSVQKAVRYAMRIFLSYQRPQRGEIAYEIAYYGASMLRFCARDSQRDVGRGEGITGDDDDC